MKFATFVEAPAGGVDALQQWIATDYVRQIPAAAPTLRGCVYRIGRESPGTFFDSRVSSLDPRFGKLDVLIESWFSSTEDFRREMLPLEAQFAERDCRFASYHVVPRLQLDPRIAEAGQNGMRPGITTVCPIIWKQGITPEQAWARYDRHAAIAMRAQTAITKYEQNLVQEVISWSTDVIPMDAYADFSHLSVEACRQGLFATHEEMLDTSGYVGGGRFSYLGDAQPVPH